MSAFQIHFASRDILTPGDTPNVLVAMNPAALKANLPLLRRGATILVNEDAFSVRAIREGRAMRSRPLEDGTLDGFTVKRVPMSSLTTRAVEDIEGATGAGRAEGQEPASRSACSSWLYDRADGGHRALDRAASSRGPVRDGEPGGLPRRLSFGETSELIDVQVKVDPNTEVAPGTYRNVNGTEATALGPDRRASVESGLPLVFAAYPITPASDLLHALARRHDMGVRTIQAEDEIAAAVDGARRGVRRRARRDVRPAGPGWISKTETIAPRGDARAAARR